jgi:integrase
LLRRRHCHDAPSAQTIGDIRKVLRSALSRAVAEELVPRNVAVPVKLPPARARKRKAWSSDEARRFLESARADGDPFYSAYVLVLVLGFREGEVLGLTWDDVDLDAGELTIGWQLQRVRGQLLHRETKTEGSDATLPLPSICVTALRLRRTEQDEAASRAGTAWQGTNLVFTTRTARR